MVVVLAHEVLWLGFAKPVLLWLGDRGGPGLRRIAYFACGLRARAAHTRRSGDGALHPGGGRHPVTPVVTVVTPVYNGAAHLEPTLRSVREQTLGDVLHVVVDDGSTDATPEIVASAAAADPRLRVVRQANQGLSDGAQQRPRPRPARQRVRDVPGRRRRPAPRGARAADGRPARRPGVRGGARGGCRRSTAPGAPSRSCAARRPPAVASCAPSGSGRPAATSASWRPGSRRTSPRLAYVLFVYTVGQVLIRPAPLAAVGAFDPRSRVAQDYDLWLRLATLGPLRSVSDVVLDYRQGEVSLSADQTTTRREDLHARFKAITDRRVPAATRRAARDNHRHHEWHRAADRFDYACVALRDRDLGLTGREAVRSARSAVEAILAVPPWTWPYDRRVRAYRRRWEVG